MLIHDQTQLPNFLTILNGTLLPIRILGTLSLMPFFCRIHTETADNFLPHPLKKFITCFTSIVYVITWSFRITWKILTTWGRFIHTAFNITLSGYLVFKSLKLIFRIWWTFTFSISHCCTFVTLIQPLASLIWIQKLSFSSESWTNLFQKWAILFKNGLFFQIAKQIVRLWPKFFIFRYQGYTNYRAIKSKLKTSKLFRFELSCQQLDIFFKENFINENW